MCRCRINHFSQIWYLFCMTFLTHLHWKSNTILNYKINSPCFIHVLSLLYYQGMNTTSLTFSMEISHYLVAIFVSNGMFVCLSRFTNSALCSKTAFFLWTSISEVCLWVKFDNVVLGRLPVFRLYLTLIIQRTSYQIHAWYTSGINNGRKIHATWHLIAPLVSSSLIYFFYDTQTNM